MDPNKEYLKKMADKNRTEFSFWSWVLRLISLCIAFGAIIYYLMNNNGPTDPYEESSLIEEAFFGEDAEGDADEKQSHETEDIEEGKRPDMQIPVFRSGE